MKPYSKQTKRYRWIYLSCKKDWNLGASSARSLRKFFKRAYHKTVRRQIRREVQNQTKNLNI